MKKRYCCIIICLIIVIDQIIKGIVSKYLIIGEIRPLIGDIIRLNYLTNTGAAFSIRRKKQFNSPFIQYYYNCFIYYIHNFKFKKNE